MPVPGGEITTSEILVPKVEEVVEVSTIDISTFESPDIELPAGLDTNDLPEL